MQESIFPFIKNTLAELNMYPVIECMNNKASKQEIIKEFEKNLLYQNPQYRTMLKTQLKSQINPKQWEQLVRMYKKQELTQHPKMNLIYQFLQSLENNRSTTDSTTSVQKTNN
ncbi:hypothetical protein [Oceanobacillus halophilus]|uniref:Uncharacterized protein n=1 Tax=Oceanobacillus halophilus TaxID=930130 RepID=A0A494ZV43_9BACI|nr:hypothetical protein [Oceanobacillus halophilus]RKQ29676.1 hypothetical protein D8M06_17250 [Oceanobacillus halophilus]